MTPKLLVIEKDIQNLNNLGGESCNRRFYLYTILNSSSQLEEIYLDAEIKTLMNFLYQT